MSELICEIRELDVEPHPDADRLDLVRPRGTQYVCISQKDRFKTGDLALYIGEGAVVPEPLLRFGFWDEEEDKGMLAGPKGDRVKAIKLRGIMSQGILFDIEDMHDTMADAGTFDSYTEGMEIAEALDVTKYVPEIPSSLDGEVYPCDTILGYTEIENEKRYPDLLTEGEDVVATEKIHGSCAVYHMEPKVDGSLMHVASKGFAKKGLAIAISESNAYWQASDLYEMPLILAFIQDNYASIDEAVTLYAEIHGRGVQDLQYGLSDKRLRVFDIRIGKDRWMPFKDMQQALIAAGYYTHPDTRPLGWVPLLYEGPYDRELLVAIANEKKSTLSDDTVREGLVVKAQPERRDDTHGRAIVKVISDRYLNRKNGTEYE